MRELHEVLQHGQKTVQPKILFGFFLKHRFCTKEILKYAYSH